MFYVIRIIHCVERVELIGTLCNLTLFTAQYLLYDIYAKPSTKFSGRVFLVAALIWSQVTVEAHNKKTTRQMNYNRYQGYIIGITRWITGTEMLITWRRCYLATTVSCCIYWTRINLRMEWVLVIKHKQVKRGRIGCR